MNVTDETCRWHPTADGDGEPTGPKCGAPATHVIYWQDGSGRYSPCCEQHSHDVGDNAPPRIVKPIDAS